ncbi:response regulator [Rubritalea tangerina]|uniref:Response regulator n=1 Tax=Rubritalea tangerina TaxID=430798 RepID=A0ABW4Z9K4_9BACT
MHEASKTCILIVDDRVENIDILTALLGDSFKIKVATNGNKAIQLASSHPQPDLILLDVEMPEMDGYQVCESLKSNPQTSDISVIFLTARAEKNDQKHGFMIGADDYITKPFDPDITRSRIESRLQLITHKKQLTSEIENLKNQSPRFDRDLSEPEISEILSQGETEFAEFKSTLRYHLHAKRNDAKIENQCLKSVAAFLNGNGGYLFVGVDDDGIPLGLNADNFKNDDKLLLHWHNLLRTCMGAETSEFIRSNIVSIKGTPILLIQCSPSSKPVFLSRDGEEHFYVRMGNSTLSLKPSEMLAYVDSHFGSAR